ncbi:sushi, von Willebrand factor type A, EGF and pentraxin domain-containing protein 1-like [Mustelus asterias]
MLTWFSKKDVLFQEVVDGIGNPLWELKLAEGFVLTSNIVDPLACVRVSASLELDVCARLLRPVAEKKVADAVGAAVSPTPGCNGVSASHVLIRAVKCIRPDPLLNGRIIAGFGPTYSYQETITYSCNNGFEMDGLGVIHCSENSTFVPQPPTCRPSTVNCGNPKGILNGSYKTSGHTIGSIATFHCNRGYRIVGRNTQLCTANGWSGQAPICQFVGCQAPDQLANGRIVAGFGPLYKHRETITYSCNEGYEMYGSNVIECSENNIFAPPPPTCRPSINCGNPGEILNGNYRAPSKTVGSKVTFYCDIGFKLVGKDYRLCTPAGWDGEVPSCQPITCGNPGEIQHGYYRAPNKTVGNIATYYCAVGYKMLGRDYRECTAEGWDGAVPSCEPLDCGDPGEILNGYYIEPNETTGNKVTFYCDVGYKIVGRDYRQCTTEGWDGEVPVCESITCGNPGAIANGYFKAPNWTVGNNVTFYCDIGYNIVGRDYRQCTAEGWDGEVPSCERINCGQPGEILNGYSTAPNQTVGNKVTFYCDIGYKMVGRDYLQCTTEGWDGEVPSCERINCGQPGEILNGYSTAPNQTVGNKVTFYCDIGYKMVGRDYLQCTTEGWDGEVPSCEPITCGNPGEILNGYYKAPNKTVGNRVTFYCDFGHKMLGRDYRECTADGWNGEVPSCKPLNCSDPGKILNGYYIAPNKTFGNKVTFYCDSGYNIVGRDYQQCTAEGWDGEVPSCEPINCGNPGKILNGYYTAPNETIGNKVTFYCDTGYKMVGRDHRQCTAKGWDGEIPFCEPITCGNPGAIMNGYYKAPNWTVGNNVTFYCGIGYNIVGRDYRQCTAEGWDSEIPFCEPINCGDPGEILNGYYTAPNQTVGNKVTFYCDIGYKMVGRDYLQCTAEGWDGEVPSCELFFSRYQHLDNCSTKEPTAPPFRKYNIVGRDYRQCTAEGWNGQAPSCELINCDHPGEILNGYYSAQNKTVGNKVTFYCDIGYKMVGRDYRQCTTEGWDGEVPSCEPITCGNPGEIQNGYYKAPNKTVGNRVTFYCDFGYKMVGRDYLQCTAEGWDDEVPSCEPINCGDPGEILNGYYTAPNQTVGNKVTFYCDIGNGGVGVKSCILVDDGTFRRFRSCSCQEVDLPPWKIKEVELEENGKMLSMFMIDT